MAQRLLLCLRATACEFVLEFVASKDSLKGDVTYGKPE